MVQYVDLDEEVAIPIPDDWVVEIESIGWQAWAHSPDGEVGVLEYGLTKDEALKKLKIRMEDWLSSQ